MFQDKGQICIDLRAKAEKIKNKLVKYRFGIHEEIVGCTKEEIVEIEKDFGLKLPYSYKVFLEYFGRKMGSYVFNDVDIFYKDMFEILRVQKRDVGNSNIGDPVEGILPKNSLIFGSRLGIQSLYLALEEGNDDPPVFRDNDTCNPPECVASSIMEIIEDEVDSTKEWLDKLNKTRKNN